MPAPQELRVLTQTLFSPFDQLRARLCGFSAESKQSVVPRKGRRVQATLAPQQRSRRGTPWSALGQGKPRHYGRTWKFTLLVSVRRGATVWTGPLVAPVGNVALM